MNDFNDTLNIVTSKYYFEGARVLNISENNTKYDLLSLNDSSYDIIIFSGNGISSILNKDEINETFKEFYRLLDYYGIVIFTIRDINYYESNELQNDNINYLGILDVKEFIEPNNFNLLEYMSINVLNNNINDEYKDIIFWVIQK